MSAVITPDYFEKTVNEYKNPHLARRILATIYLHTKDGTLGELFFDNPFSALNLGSMFRYSLGVPEKDFSHALSYLAEKGLAEEKSRPHRETKSWYVTREAAAAGRDYFSRLSGNVSGSEKNEDYFLIDCFVRTPAAEEVLGYAIESPFLELRYFVEDAITGKEYADLVKDVPGLDRIIRDVEKAGDEEVAMLMKRAGIKHGTLSEDSPMGYLKQEILPLLESIGDRTFLGNYETAKGITLPIPENEEEHVSRLIIGYEAEDPRKILEDRVTVEGKLSGIFERENREFPSIPLRMWPAGNDSKYRIILQDLKMKKHPFWYNHLSEEQQNAIDELTRDISSLAAR